MRLLFYCDLDAGKLKTKLKKVQEAIERGDFKTPDIKKLAQGPCYHAKLDERAALKIKPAQPVLRNNGTAHRIQCQAIVDKHLKALLVDTECYGVAHCTSENLTLLVLALNAEADWVSVNMLPDALGRGWLLDASSEASPSASSPH